MEFASSYLPDEYNPCFYIGYYSTDRELRGNNYFRHASILPELYFSE